MVDQGNAGRHGHITGCARVAVISIVVVAVPVPGIQTLAQHEPDTSSSNSTTEPIRPRDNSEFYGVKTTATISRQFEMYNPHSKESLQILKDMGFTQVILDWPNLHREASDVGLDVVLANWWTDKTPQHEIDRSIELAMQVERGRLVGISVMDEPERNAPETPFGYYIELYDKLRPRLDRELPAVRVELSHWGPLATWDQRYYDYFAYLYEAADVMRIMPYPDLDEGPLDDVYLMMLRSRELMQIAGRELPLLVILQTWVFPPKSELPTIDELRVMAYQAMLGGAETVSFFDYNRTVWAESPGFHDGFAKLMCELTQLSRRFADATIESSMNEHGILQATITSASGRVTTLLVNTNRMRVNNLDSLAIVEYANCEQTGCVPSRPCTQPACCRIARPCRAKPVRIRRLIPNILGLRRVR